MTLTLDHPVLHVFVDDFRKSQDAAIPLIAADWFQEQGTTADDMRHLFIAGLPVEFLTCWMEHAGFYQEAQQAKRIELPSPQAIPDDAMREAQSFLGAIENRTWRLLFTQPAHAPSRLFIPTIDDNHPRFADVTLERRDYGRLLSLGPLIWRERSSYWIGDCPERNEILWCNWQPDLERQGRDYLRDILATFTPLTEVMLLLPEEEPNTRYQEMVHGGDLRFAVYLTERMVKERYWLDLLREMGINTRYLQWANTWQ